jgi:hypothetical protein
MSVVSAREILLARLPQPKRVLADGISVAARPGIQSRAIVLRRTCGETQARRINACRESSSRNESSLGGFPIEGGGRTFPEGV